MTEISLRGLGHRFLQLIVSLFILLCITFIIGRVMPTDPVGAIVGELADPKAYEAMRARLGSICRFTSSSSSICAACCMVILALRS